MTDPDAIAAPAAIETLGGVGVELLTPLERAAGMGAAQSTAELLMGSKTVPLDVTVAEGRPLRRTVLHWAAFGGNPEVVSTVLQSITKGAAAAYISQQPVTNFHENTPDATAAAATASLVEELQATCIGSTSLGGTTALHLAAEHGHAAAAVVLLDAGAIDTLTNDDEEQPLRLAVAAGHEQVTLELLRRGTLAIDAELDVAGSTALHIAAMEGHLTMVELLLREGAAVDVRDGFPEQTPLHRAVGCHRPSAGAVVTVLLAAGAEADALDHAGSTALLTAVSMHDSIHDASSVMRALIAGGANPHDSGNVYNASPAQAAILGGHVEALSKMFELGVDPNARTPFITPLPPLPPGASFMERLNHDAKHRAYGGDSLLHFAARTLGVPAVELLLSAGAREDIPAFSAPPEDPKAIATLPADVIGDHWNDTTNAEDCADAIRSLLADAKLYRRGWLSVLRARFDAGESLTGNTIGGNGGTVEILVPGRHRTRGASAGRDGNDSAQQEGGAGAGDVVEEVWYGAAVWLATVSDEEVFRMVVEHL